MSNQGRHQKRRAPVSTDDMVEICTMYLNGCSYDIIAASTGRKVGFVRSIINGDAAYAEDARKLAEANVVAKLDAASREHAWYAQYKRAAI